MNFIAVDIQTSTKTIETKTRLKHFKTKMLPESSSLPRNFVKCNFFFFAMHWKTSHLESMSSPWQQQHQVLAMSDKNTYKDDWIKSIKYRYKYRNTYFMMLCRFYFFFYKVLTKRRNVKWLFESVVRTLWII